MLRGAAVGEGAVPGRGRLRRTRAAVGGEALVEEQFAPECDGTRIAGDAVARIGGFRLRPGTMRQDRGTLGIA